MLIYQVLPLIYNLSKVFLCSKPSKNGVSINCTLSPLYRKLARNRLVRDCGVSDQVVSCAKDWLRQMMTEHIKNVQGKDGSAEESAQDQHTAKKHKSREISLELCDDSSSDGDIDEMQAAPFSISAVIKVECQIYFSVKLSRNQIEKLVFCYLGGKILR